MAVTDISLPNLYLSPQVQKLRTQCPDSLTLKLLDQAISRLASVENRLSRPRCDGYYRKYDACHLRFRRGLAVFYRYNGNHLSILAVMHHIGGKNDYELI